MTKQNSFTNLQCISHTFSPDTVSPQYIRRHRIHMFRARYIPTAMGENVIEEMLDTIIPQGHRSVTTMMPQWHHSETSLVPQ